MLQSFAITPSLNYNGMLYSRQTYKSVKYDEGLDEDGNPFRNPYVHDTLINKISYAHSLFPSISSGFAPKTLRDVQFQG